MGRAQLPAPARRRGHAAGGAGFQEPVNGLRLAWGWRR
jgi:hypothetical protein